MAENTHIEWCDHTFNPWEGCTKVSPGCANCYAHARNRRFGGGTAPNWGPGAVRRRTSAANWKLPLRWNKQAEGGVEFPADVPPWTKRRRPRVFCASLADWLDDEVPVEWLADLLDLIRRTPNLDWLLLTKRPENWRRKIEQVAGMQHEADRLCIPWYEGCAPRNVWIGTSVEDQPRAKERIPHLLNIPARVRFLSCEPLLGSVDLSYACFNGADSFGAMPGIDWVICGGESGPGARLTTVEWAWDLRLQCRRAGVPFFMKQLGARPVTDNANALDWPDSAKFYNLKWRMGAQAAAEVFVTDPKGGNMAEFPAELQVREFPEVRP